MIRPREHADGATRGWVRHRRYNNRGKVQHAINGTNFGAICDAHLNSSKPDDPDLYQRIRLGTRRADGAARFSSHLAMRSRNSDATVKPPP